MLRKTHSACICATLILELYWLDQPRTLSVGTKGEVYAMNRISDQGQYMYPFNVFLGVWVFMKIKILKGAINFLNDLTEMKQAIKCWKKLQRNSSYKTSLSTTFGWG